MSKHIGFSASERSLALEDFWQLKAVGDIQVAPDGTKLACTVISYHEEHNKQYSAIWIISLVDNQRWQATSGKTQDTHPRWSHDGTKLAFVSTDDKDLPQIFVLSVEGREIRRITSMEQGAFAPVWSPVDMKLCFSATVRSSRQDVPQEIEWQQKHPQTEHVVQPLRLQRTLMSRLDGAGYVDRFVHLFLIDYNSDWSKSRQITAGDYDDLEASWSPDGKLIAFTSSRSSEAEHSFVTDIWTVDVDTGALRCTTDSTLIASAPLWSPDGQSIAFYGAPLRSCWESHLWTVAKDGQNQQNRSALLDKVRRGAVGDYFWPEESSPVWSADGSTIYFLAGNRGDGVVYAFELASESIQRVSPTHVDIARIQCVSHIDVLVCLASTPTHPYDIFILSLSTHTVQPLGHINKNLLDRVTLVCPEDLHFSTPDGYEIEGWLIKPQAQTTQPYPLIVHVHGGPNAMWTRSFLFLGQALAAQGYASLYINPRGSLGYGSEFARAADWGEKDYLDIMRGLDMVLLQSDIDAGRLGITGLSYGGFMTNWALAHSDRFAAGVAVNGISNLFSMYGVSDFAPILFEEDLGGPFWLSEAQWQRYRDHSPIFYVDHITAPLLLIQSENDYRCPIDQGEQMLTALRMLKKKVELIRFPGASHIIARTGVPHQRYLEWKLVIDWFNRFIKDKPERIRQKAMVSKKV